MPDTTRQGTIREAVAVFVDAETLEAAIDDLESHEFDRAQLSLLAGRHAVEEKLGHRYAKAAEVEDDPEVPRTAYVSREAIGDAEGALIGGLVYVGAAGAVVATAGTLATAIVAATLSGAAGGLIGSALANLVDRHHADYLQDQLERGGLLLWVRTFDAPQEKLAVEILERHSAEDVHVHDLPVSQDARLSVS